MSVGSGGETDLVVDDHMDGTTDVVIFKGLHLEGLSDNTLSGHGGISVNNDGDNLAAVFFSSPKEVLLSTGSSLDDRVDALKMGGVREQRDFNLGSRSASDTFSVNTFESSSEMVFDVTGAKFALFCFGGSDALEFGHDDLHGLSDDVGQHVESSSVRHTDDKSPCSAIDEAVNGELKSGHEGLAALKAESFHGIELGPEELSPRVGPVESGVHVELLPLVKGIELDALELVSDPLALCFIRYMHKFDSDFATVGPFISLD